MYTHDDISIKQMVCNSDLDITSSDDEQVNAIQEAQ